jgi:hypothetical protein
MSYRFCNDHGFTFCTCDETDPPQTYFPECKYQYTSNVGTMCLDKHNKNNGKPCDKRCESPTKKGEE